MKCVKNPIDNQIKRVTETEAKRLVAYGWIYTTKGAWKREVRPKLTPIKAKAQQIVAGMGQGLRRPI